MNFEIKDLPARSEKPRQRGITMVMDKGLSLAATESFLSIGAPYVDFVKLGFGTAFVTNCLREKLNLYKQAGIATYLGGTLFEAFLVRDQFDDYLRVLDDYEIEHAEVSDGSMDMDHGTKCGYIRTLASRVIVLSEVGSKDADKILAPYQWIELMKKELDAGAQRVIAEAREGGTVGIYRSSGEVRQGLVQEILTQIPGEKIIWEAPQKAQQVFFIKLLGYDVNLGNIAPEETLPLETLRLGLRGDTFHRFLPTA
jgi:phosphosulfolactate synthase